MAMPGAENLDAIFRKMRPQDVVQAQVATAASRNGSMQGGDLVLAARAAGLGCDAMSGPNNAGVDAACFAGTGIESDFPCEPGYGDASKAIPRKPRPSFGEACRLP